MASEAGDHRATELAENALKSYSDGLVEDATRQLKEALSLAPDNAKVKDALIKIRSDDSNQPLLKLCKQFALEKDLKAGKDALSFLRSGNGPSVAAETQKDCFVLVYDHEDIDEELRDELVAGLIQHCIGARAGLANKLRDSTSPTFERVFKIGDGAANAITATSLDAAAWPNEKTRRSLERDIFLLFLAKLLESGHDYDGRAIKGISRHLAIDAERLHNDVDEESFDAILDCLDYRLPYDIRGQATLATAKYLEASQKTGEQYLTRYITKRTAKQASEALVLAFSAAAAVFPIATPLISSLFLTEGFLPSLIPLLDKKSRPIKVEKAALDMLSAACIDAGCREAIAKYCWDWMHHVMEDEEDERHGQAALILAKVQSHPEDTQKSTNGHGSAKGHARRPSKSIAEVVPKLKEMLMNGGEIDRRTALEGLAYASVQPTVKENIVNDEPLLRKMLELPRKDAIPPGTAYGFLTLADNLTRYLPNLSEEQRKLADLKSYASAQKPSAKPHELDEDEAVTKRCKRLLDASVVPYLITLKSTSVTAPLSVGCLGLFARIILSLSKTPSHRGTLAQQGSIPLLLQIHATQNLPAGSKYTAAHALARILISVNPSLISSYISACIPPLITLLNTSAIEDDGSGSSPFATQGTSIDLLPTFEALLALTNLTSDPNAFPQASQATVDTAYENIETLMLHRNPLVQRAATELLCNLAQHPAGLEKIADGSPAAVRRINVLLALADAEDVQTRRAASGALAGAGGFEGGARAVLARANGVARCVAMCSDEDPDVVHRGVVVVGSLATVQGGAGAEVRAKLRAEGAAEVLGGLVGKGGPVGSVAAEALKELKSDG